MERPTPTNLREFARYGMLLAFALCSSIFQLGCQLTSKEEGLLERAATDADVSSRQLRVMVNEFVIYYSDRVEFTADTILAKANDPAVRKSALLWKINAISEAYQAASRNDPLGAYLDLRIMSLQTLALIDSEAGRELFGSWQATASEECHRLDRRLKTVQAQLGAETRFGEDFVAGFAADYPMNSLYFDREPIASRYIEEVRADSGDLMHVVAHLEENIDELRMLSVQFAEHIPKQARWEAELFLLSAAQIPVLGQSLQKMAIATEAATTLANTVEQLPELIERERLAVQQIVEQERLETLAQLEQMRSETVHELGAERAIILAALSAERETVLQQVAEERLAVTAELQQQLATSLDRVDVITQQRIQEAVTSAPSLIDHFFQRVAQLLSLILALVAAVWVVVEARRRKVIDTLLRRAAHTGGRNTGQAAMHASSDAAGFARADEPTRLSLAEGTSTADNRRAGSRPSELDQDRANHQGATGAAADAQANDLAKRGKVQPARRTLDAA